MTSSGYWPRPVKSQSAFTLLEILLVVLIIGIMTVAGANLINSQSIERIIVNHAKQFESDLTFICEKSVLENQSYGIEWLEQGYQVLRYQQPEWMRVETQVQGTLTDGVQAEIRLDGYPQLIADEAENLPHIVCQSDGSFNGFEVRFFAAQDSNSSGKQDHYALSSKTPWELVGAWHEE